MVRGVGGETLVRRPAPEAWAAVEVVCHLRDLEESFHERLTLILAVDAPRFPTTHPGRWAVERQYLRQDAGAAVDTFAAWRTETLALFGRLPSAAWERAAKSSRGRCARRIERRWKRSIRQEGAPMS